MSDSNSLGTAFCTVVLLLGPVESFPAEGVLYGYVEVDDRGGHLVVVRKLQDET